MMLYHPPFWLWITWGCAWSIAAIVMGRRFVGWEQAFGFYILFLLPVPFGTLFSVALTCRLLGWVS